MDMLRNVKNAIKNDYYDPKFGGLDLEANFLDAEKRLKASETLPEAFTVIADAVLKLNDSHTTFYPPATNMAVEYGWRISAVGEHSYITAVRPDSDADKKGLKVGDEVLAINGERVTRSDLWKMMYYYRVLNPQTKMTLTLRDSGGAVRTIEAASKVTRLKAIISLTDPMDVAAGVRQGAKASANTNSLKDLGGVLIWKMNTFAFPPEDVDNLMERARGKQALIIDLRGNGGGYVVTLEEIAGYFFDKKTKIADYQARKPIKPQFTKPQGAGLFQGRVIVLVDSGSASASEIFARLMQIEKRGVVIGDRSAGAVMMSQGTGFDAGTQNMISYGMNLTRADVIMTDGKSLEHVGVTPQLILLPTAKDIAEGRDPVLAGALKLLGVEVDPAEAGKYFPREKFQTTDSQIALYW